MAPSPLRRLLHRILGWSGPVLLVLVGIHQVAVWLSERLWFESLGYGAQFDRLFAWHAGSFGAGALLFGGWLGFNAHLAWRNCARRSVPLSFFQTDDAARLIPLEDKLHLDRYRRRATFLTLVALSWLAGLGFSSRYALFLRAFSGQGSGQIDPASGFDLAFFLFALPFYGWLSRVLLVALVSALALCAAIYAYEEVLGSRAGWLAPGRGTAPRSSGEATKHLAILWAMLLLWQGCKCVLSVPASFVSSGGVATRVFDGLDISWGWTCAGLFAFSAPLVALLSGLSVAREPRLRVFMAGAGWMAAASLLPTLLPLVIARDPHNAGWNGAISRHIGSTRRAWGLDHVDRRSLAAAGGAFRNGAGEASTGSNSALLSHSNGAATVGDVFSPLPLWPAGAAQIAMNRRLASGGSRARVAQVWLERSGDALMYCGLATAPKPDAPASWRALHERQAGGVWMQMWANRVAASGAPLFRPDVPVPTPLGASTGASSALRGRSGAPGSLGASNLESDGEDDDEWILARGGGDDIPPTEADSPRGVSLHGVSRRGVSLRGVSLRGWGARMLLATRFLEPNLAREASLTDQVIWHRGAAQRCRELAPFLDWPEAEARAVWTSDDGFGGRGDLQWIVPGVVWSEDYPDSAAPNSLGAVPVGADGAARYPGANYGRHIAAGVVDARTGATTLFWLDPTEPFAALYQRAFPGLFRLPTDLPATIRAALRPSASLLSAQTQIWARYHELDSLSWVAHRGDYRSLFGAARWGESELRPLASRASGDWNLMAYARPESQISSGTAAPLAAILGADERDFGSGGALHFAEWRCPAPLPLPSILVEPLSSRPAGLAAPLPMLAGVAPRLDAQGAARGLIASAGTVISPPETSDALAQLRLQAEIRISGAPLQNAPKTASAVSKLFPLAPEPRLEAARAAWRDVREARKRGDWEAVARAEKRLDAALNPPTQPATTPASNAPTPAPAQR